MVIAAAALAAVSCGSGPVRNAAGMDIPESVMVGNVSMAMKNVEGGTFAMGMTPDGVKASGAAIHQVVLHGFSISADRVSRELWNSVMGTADSQSRDSDAADMVSWDDCRKFVSKLSRKTGIPFSLPTEAQWEYAVRKGIVNAVPDGEWCQDYFEDAGTDSLTVDPAGPAKGQLRVMRTVKARKGEQSYVRMPGVGFHVVANTCTPVPEDVIEAFIDRKMDREFVSASEKFTVGSQTFLMTGVQGGTFRMGATEEQKTSDPDEKPVHEVTLSGFEIGQTEVTAGLWKEVMGTLPYRNSDSELNKPVVNVSWYDCQSFILKLNRMTGRKFRLPTEAEWEFAARGGNRSRGTDLSGSQYPSQVAAYSREVIGKVVPVKSFMPNELGIYDMSGNAWEWCFDSPYDYSAEASSDPYCAEAGELRIMRGGSAASKWDACRVSNRSKIPASSVKTSFGFRLAL